MLLPSTPSGVRIQSNKLPPCRGNANPPPTAGAEKPHSLENKRRETNKRQKENKGSSSKALSNFAPRELLSITQAKFLCKRLFRVLLKSFPRLQRPLIRIVDDDKALAGSFGLLLETMGWDTAAYTSGRRFLNNDDLSRPGCIVLDVRMPGLTGPEIQDKLIEMGCRLPIIFLSAHGSIPTAVSAVQKGAVDFLEKPIEPAELIAKINAAVARSVTESVETMHRDRLRARFETLTAREREIIGEILKGDGSETNKQIARTFDLELSTVKMHRSNAFMKLGVHSAAELIRLAQEAGIHAEA